MTKLPHRVKICLLMQGVVTPIGAVLMAETGDTICVHRNSRDHTLKSLVTL